MLATILLIGAVVGAQLGTIAGARLKAEQLRAALGLMVLAVGLRVLWELRDGGSVTFRELQCGVALYPWQRADLGPSSLPNSANATPLLVTSASC